MVCQLESSGKWPDEVEAIKQIKAAFYVKMSELLSGEHSLLSSPTFDYLDILKVILYISGPYACACMCVCMHVCVLMNDIVIGWIYI